MISEEIRAKFEEVIESQLARIEDMKSQGDFIDYTKLDKIIIGVCGGDGIGPMITGMAQHALEALLADKVKAGKVEFRTIDGLTIERRAELGCAIPPDALEELKACHVILKGPTTTPRAGDPWPNVESANVAMRKALDLLQTCVRSRFLLLALTGPSTVKTPKAGMRLDRRGCRSATIFSLILR